MTRFKNILLPLALLALPGLVACGDDGGDDGNAGAPDAEVIDDTPDAEVAPQDIDITLNFAGKVGAETFACTDGKADKVYSGLGTQSSDATIKDFRFYVSNIRLINGDGDEVALTLENNDFQLQSGDDHVALLDFEDGTGSCAGTGNAALNSTVTGTVPDDSYTGVVFDVGVPFALNHLDVATADTPLNIGGLYWAWAIGHKFMRIDYVVDGTPWNFHLGSTMCVSDGMDSPPSAECGRPNRPLVRLESFDHATDTIVMDAAAIVADSDVTQNLATMTPGCMSFPHDDADCTPLFPNFGMTYSSGACETDCSDQTVFTVE